jgi:hypothetical protein
MSAEFDAFSKKGFHMNVVSIRIITETDRTTVNMPLKGIGESVEILWKIRREMGNGTALGCFLPGQNHSIRIAKFANN